jgi:hypothetical protein
LQKNNECEKTKESEVQVIQPVLHWKEAEEEQEQKKKKIIIIIQSSV